MMRLRYGDNFARSTQAIAYGEAIKLGDVTIKFHPAACAGLGADRGR